MMLIVILCHSCAIFSRSGWFNQRPAFPSELFSFISDWMGTFHVYTFTFISGYIFYYLKFEKNKYRCYKTAIYERAKRLLIPYIFISLFWAIPFYIHYFRPSIKMIMMNFLFGGGPAQLWFIWMIFILFVIFLIFSNFFQKINAFSGFALSIGMYFIGVVAELYLPNAFQLLTSCKFFVFFYMGFEMRKNDFSNIFEIKWYVWFLLNICLFGVDYFFLSTKNSALYGVLSCLLILLSQISGTIMVVVGISKIRMEKLQKNSVYKFLKKITLECIFFISKSFIYL